jgi:hypothetical protein
MNPTLKTENEVDEALKDKFNWKQNAKQAIKIMHLYV